MRVTNDLALAVELLGCGKVIFFGVHEVTGLYALDHHLDGEILVSLHCSKILWEHEFARRHRSGGRDLAHRGRVARSSCDLLAVGNGLVRSETEADEVVSGRQRGHLACFLSPLTILGKARGDNGGIKSYTCMMVHFLVDKNIYGTILNELCRSPESPETDPEELVDWIYKVLSALGLSNCIWN